MATAALAEGDVGNALKVAPGWELKNLEGKTVKLSDFRGKVVILNFWATWCMPCRVEIPHFVDLQKQYGDKGLAVVGVSLDEQGPQVVRKFVKEFGVNYPVVMGDEKIAGAYGSREFPLLLSLIDADVSCAGTSATTTRRSLKRKFNRCCSGWSNNLAAGEVQLLKQQ